MKTGYFVLKGLMSATIFGGVIATGLAAFAGELSVDDPPAMRQLGPLAEAGDTFAQYTLGLMYRDGWDAPKDVVRALKWLSLAASRSPPGSEREAAVLARADVAAQMSADQRDEAQKLAQEWFSQLVLRDAAKGKAAEQPYHGREDALLGSSP